MWQKSDLKGAEMGTIYQCTECGEDVPFDEVAYLGSEDDEVCSPFIQLTCLCVKCYKLQDDFNAGC
jgi:hypothetical protein